MEGVFIFSGFVIFAVITVVMALINLLLSNTKTPWLVFVLPSVGLPLSILAFIFVVIVPFTPYAIFLFGGSIALFYASGINLLIAVALYFSKRKRTPKRS